MKPGSPTSVTPTPKYHILNLRLSTHHPPRQKLIQLGKDSHTVNTKGKDGRSIKLLGFSAKSKVTGWDIRSVLLLRSNGRNAAAKSVAGVQGTSRMTSQEHASEFTDIRVSRI
jgi:uncharacterized ubiquitin-like protein YukD